jgi:hypothetical protein
LRLCFILEADLLNLTRCAPSCVRESNSVGVKIWQIMFRPAVLRCRIKGNTAVTKNGIHFHFLQTHPTTD